MTRGSFVLRGAVVAGGAYATGAAGILARSAFAQNPGDIDILNFALTLEHLEAAFYEQAYQQVSGLGGDARALTEELRDNEREHVVALTKLVEDIGGDPVKKPKFDFGNAFSSESSYLKLAQTFEDTGVKAYNGAGPLLQDKELLTTAGTIVQIEGRHAALVRMLRGEDIAPSPFDETLTMAQVLDMVQRFIKS